MPEQLVGFLCLCVLGRGGRSQESLSKCHLVNWNNRDSVTGWLYKQIHPSKHKHTRVSHACTELKDQPEISLPSSFCFKD